MGEGRGGLRRVLGGWCENVPYEAHRVIDQMQVVEVKPGGALGNEGRYHERES